MSQENNFIPNQKEYCKLRPFQLFMKDNFPFIENTYESLDIYGLLCKVVEFLNNVIKNEIIVTENQQAVYDAFVELNTYVSSYFDNLDVQEEINNKLDDMANNGTLQNLIQNYANLTVSIPAALNSSAITSSCVIMKILNKSIMYDLGTIESYGNIRNKLEELEIEKLDVVIISHFDADHCENYQNIINNYCDENTKFYLGMIPDDISLWDNDLTLYNGIISALNAKNYLYETPENNSIVNFDNIFSIKFFNTDRNAITYYENYTGEYSDKPTFNLLSLCCIINFFNQTKIYLDGDAERPTQIYNIDSVEETDLYYGNHHATNLNGFYQYFNKINPKIILLSNNSTTTPASYLNKYMYFNKLVETITTQNQTEINLSVINNKIKINSGNVYKNNYYEGNTLMSIDQILPYYSDYTTYVENNNTKKSWTLFDIMQMIPYIKNNISCYVDSSRDALFAEIKSLFSDLLNYTPSQYFLTLNQESIEIIPNTNWTNIKIKIIRGFTSKTETPNNIILEMGESQQINKLQTLTQNGQSISYRNEMKANIQIKDSLNNNVYSINCFKQNFSAQEFNGFTISNSFDSNGIYLTTINVSFTIINGVLTITSYKRSTYRYGLNYQIIDIVNNDQFTPYRISFI